MRSKAHKHIAWALFNHFCLEKGNNRSLIRSYNSGTYGRAPVRQLFRFAAPFIQISVLLQWQEDNEVDLLIFFLFKKLFLIFVSGSGWNGRDSLLSETLFPLFTSTSSQSASCSRLNLRTATARCRYSNYLSSSWWMSLVWRPWVWYLRTLPSCCPTST